MHLPKKALIHTPPTEKELLKERYPSLREGGYAPYSEFVLRYHNSKNTFVNAYTTHKNLIISTDVDAINAHKHFAGILAQTDIITTELPANIQELYETSNLEGELRKPTKHLALLEGLIYATNDQPRTIYHLGAILPVFSNEPYHRQRMCQKQPKTAHKQLQQLRQEHPNKTILAFADYALIANKDL